MATTPCHPLRAAALTTGSSEENELRIWRPFFGVRSPKQVKVPDINKRLAEVVACAAAQDFADRKARTTQLWQEFFSDPSQWWDNRLTKKSPKHSDFRHKTTLEALWINSWLTPPWVKKKISAMASDHEPSGGGWTSRVPTFFGEADDKVKKLCEERKLRKALHWAKVLAQNSEAPKGAFVCLLRACARRKALAVGKQVHALIVQTNCQSDIFLANLLVDMYSKCGSVQDAHKVFTAMPQHNVFSWTAIISAYANSELYKEAIALFEQMRQTGIEPDKVACVVILKACANIGARDQGQELHSLIVKRGFDTDDLIVQTTLVDMYAKCGCLKDARELFDNMNVRNVISWNAMISGYAQHGLGKEALELYEQMKHEGLQPNISTFVVLLKACASISALEQGKQLHSLILERGLESAMIIQNTLVDMYAKCGCLEYARKLFDNMTERNVVSWNAMIAGYSQNGLGKEALYLYKHMKQDGMQADEVTYMSVLSACSHSGLVDEGHFIFETMCKDCGVTPSLEHYACMVDLLGRAGCLSDAEDLIRNMPVKPDEVVWRSLLAAARKYGDLEVGRHAFDWVVKLEPEAAAHYVLLRDIYSDVGRMEEVVHI